MNHLESRKLNATKTRHHVVVCCRLCFVRTCVLLVHFFLSSNCTRLRYPNDLMETYRKISPFGLKYWNRTLKRAKSRNCMLHVRIPLPYGFREFNFLEYSLAKNLGFGFGHNGIWNCAYSTGSCEDNPGELNKIFLLHLTINTFPNVNFYPSFPKYGRNKFVTHLFPPTLHL